MSSLPNLSVLSKLFANNANIAPTSSNNTLVEKKHFTMGHLQRIDRPQVDSILGSLDWNSLQKTTNGVLKGDDGQGNWFHLTPGVIKFKGGNHSQPPSGGGYEPPVAYPVEDSSGQVSEPYWGIDVQY